MKRLIHINTHKIRSNVHKTDEEKEPVFAVKFSYKGDRHNIYAHELEVKGGCKFIYKNESPLSCGARVWVELDEDAALLLDGVDMFKQIYKEEEYE